MAKVCITAICGGYDDLKDSQNNKDGTRFICYTDDITIKSSLWEIKPAYNEYKTEWDASIRNCKYHKIMMHKNIDCDYSLWIDGTVTLYKSITELIETYMKDYDVVAVLNTRTTCAYDEGMRCIDKKKDKEDIIRNQLIKYEKEGYPRNNGLHGGSLILRKHSKIVEEFNCFWWNEICNHSKRDQISFDYSAWKIGIKLGNFEPWPSDKLNTLMYNPIVHKTK